MRRQWLIASGVVVTFAVFFLLFRVSPVQKIHGWVSPPPPPLPPYVLSTNLPSLDIYLNEPENPGFFEWQTRSAFNPVRIEDAEHKSVEDLCASFPEHLLTEIQPIMKTGHGVLDARVRPQLQGASACLSNLLIFSDTEEYYEGHQLIDILGDIPYSMAKDAPDLEAWLNGTLADGTASRAGGWRADKFKFILGATRAWRMRPGRKWYVFYEADTYVVWDNLFRLLANFDPNEPYYFGSPTPGREKTRFANGGPGYILSREAMRRLIQNDFDQKTGHFIGPAFLNKWWYLLQTDCCGDSVLGWALWHVNVTLSGLWPHFNPHPPHQVPFSDPMWCQPVITMHKPLEEDLMSIWRWQWEQRVVERPLLYRDLAISYFNMTSRRRRDDWDGGGWESFEPPVESKFYSHDPHSSFNACDEACIAHDNCFQWGYHLRRCTFNGAFYSGKHAEPGLGKKRQKAYPKESEDDWNEEDLRWHAGWDAEKIAKWISERPCNEVKWVRPSTKRIF